MLELFYTIPNTFFDLQEQLSYTISIYALFQMNKFILHSSGSTSKLLTFFQAGVCIELCEVYYFLTLCKFNLYIAEKVVFYKCIALLKCDTFYGIKVQNVRVT